MDLHRLLVFSPFLMLSRCLGWRRSTEYDLSKGTYQPAYMISILSSRFFPEVVSLFCFEKLNAFRSWHRITRTISGDTLQTKQR